MATGTSASRINALRKRAGIEPNRNGYTYDEVKRIIKEKSRPASRHADPRRAEALKRQLQNDGYK